jgi:hypothetical protein
MNPTRKPAVLLCTLCLIGGALLLLHPIDENMIHPGATGALFTRGPDSMENISKEKCRVYGVLAILFGISLGGKTLSRERNRRPSVTRLADRIRRWPTQTYPAPKKV